MEGYDYKSKYYRKQTNKFYLYKKEVKMFKCTWKDIVTIKIELTNKQTRFINTGR